MTEEQKQQIIESGKDFFRKTIIPNHLNNLKKLKLKDFKINPFLVNYLASFLCGDTEPESIAKALIYPRILGTSISTSFGTHTQKLVSELVAHAGTASGIDGIDIEFIDAIDGRKKYCQCKAGPNTINHDDTFTIANHFTHLQYKARIDGLPIQLNDMIVGVLYGDRNELSDHYKKIDQETCPVYCGIEFWEHLTGDKQFYHRLAKAFSEVVEEENNDVCPIIKMWIEDLSKEIVEYVNTYAYKAEYA